jgi:hypothetical protein
VGLETELRELCGGRVMETPAPLTKGVVPRWAKGFVSRSLFGSLRRFRATQTA